MEIIPVAFRTNGMITQTACIDFVCGTVNIDRSIDTSILLEMHLMIAKNKTEQYTSKRDSIRILRFCVFFDVISLNDIDIYRFKLSK